MNDVKTEEILVGGLRPHDYLEVDRLRSVALRDPLAVDAVLSATSEQALQHAHHQVSLLSP